MASSGKSQLMGIFGDPSYAWELLEWEIAIEMNDHLSGQAIAHLLELYMRGVEKMNSLMDIRESYFKNKVTSLMMKGNVVKTLNKPPMAKKEKPLEISAKKEPKVHKKNGQEPQKKQQKPVECKPPVQAINTLALQQKRKEIEMRLAYEADTSSRENLAELYQKHLKKEESFNNKVKNILTQHEEKLQERINRRKLKTSTCRSRPEDTSDSFPVEQNNKVKKGQEEQFSPRGNEEDKAKKQKIKRSSSFEVNVVHDLTLETPRRSRKNTHGHISERERQQELQKKELINEFQQFKKGLQTKKQYEQVVEILLKEQETGNVVYESINRQSI